MASGAENSYGATIAKRRLSARLAKMRQDAGLKPYDVEDRLGWRRGRLGRIERGDVAIPNPSFIRDLARVYEIGDDAEAELLALVATADVRPWWRKFTQAADPDRIFEEEFPGYEADASRISVYAGQTVPDLLQTSSYTDSLVARSERSERWRERVKEAWLRRQAILDRSDGTAPRLIAVITEASLLYRWKSEEDRCAQVRHLAEASRRPNVELRLLRLADGLHPGMSSEITVFDFPDDQDPSIVFTGTDISRGAVELASPGDAQETGTFARIKRASLPPSSTTEYLDNLAGALQ